MIYVARQRKGYRNQIIMEMESGLALKVGEGPFTVDMGHTEIQELSRIPASKECETIGKEKQGCR